MAVKLRIRTQANSRSETFVVGREILAIILNHSELPDMFTMEHIVRTSCPGDSQLDAVYEKWMEMVPT